MANELVFRDVVFFNISISELSWDLGLCWTRCL